jgi:hypothetical protein
LDIEKKYIESSTTGLTRGARKLIDNKSVNLRERANFLSSKVFDRLTKEKSTLAVWIKTLKTAPITIISNNLERQTVYTKNYISRRFYPPFPDTFWVGNER